MKKIKRALISVSNKNNLRKLLLKLSKLKIEIISSGGTFKEIIKFKSIHYKAISKNSTKPNMCPSNIQKNKYQVME